jgi:hypothetical protein
MSLTVEDVRRGERVARRRLGATRRADIALAERLANVLLAGVDAVSMDELGPVDVVICGLLTNAANTYLKALDLALTGYALLANNVVRLLYEHFVSLVYVGHDLERAGRWLDETATRQVPAVKDMAKVISRGDQRMHEQLRGIRDTLNTFAHARRLVWQRSHGPKEDGGDGYRLGPTWTLDEFDNLLFPLLWLGSLTCDALQDHYGEQLDRAWVAEAETVGEAAHAWLHAYNRRAREKREAGELRD